MKIACIGSRQISQETHEKLEEIGRFIALQNWSVLSGNADGADSAYAKGANTVNPGAVTLYMPWPSYNKKYLVAGNVVVFKEEKEWIEIAKRHHPIYDRLTQGAKKMMNRNAGIVTNSQVVLAVLNHQATGFGGTGHGWRIATEYGLPRIDLSSLNSGLSVEQVCEWLKKIEEKIGQTS